MIENSPAVSALDNRRTQATLFQKADYDTWVYLVFAAKATVPLITIDLALSVDDIYDGATLDPDPAIGPAV